MLLLVLVLITTFTVITFLCKGDFTQLYYDYNELGWLPHHRFALSNEKNGLGNLLSDYFYFYLRAQYLKRDFIWKEYETHDPNTLTYNLPKFIRYDETLPSFNISKLTDKSFWSTRTGWESLDDGLRMLQPQISDILSSSLQLTGTSAHAYGHDTLVIHFRAGDEPWTGSKGYELCTWDFYIQVAISQPNVK